MRALILVLLAGCGVTDRQGARDLSGGGLPDSHITTEDGAMSHDLAGADLKGVDFSSADLGGTTADMIPAGMLDPNLSLPSASGQTCTMPGAISNPACPSVQVCRFYTPTEGRCESCSPCGNLNAVCTASSQCDILFMCYKGRCTNFCTLGTSECGPPQDCINIGHPTRGVCKV